MSSEQKNITLTSLKSQASDDSEKLFSAYDAVSTAEEAIDKIEKSIKNVMPKEIDRCNVQDIIGKVDEVVTNISNVQTTMVSAVNDVLSGGINAFSQTAANAVNIANQTATNTVNAAENAVANEVNGAIEQGQKLVVEQKYIKYLATQIILKKFQLIKYKVEIIKTHLYMIVESLKKEVLISILSGKGSSQDPINQTMVATVSSAAQKVNTIMSIISAIVTAINSTTIMNVNGAGMAFFQTPKSITKTAINVINARQSTTNIIPEQVDIAISQAEQKIKESKGKIKQSRIAAMAAKGASTAAAGQFDPGSFGSLPKFDPSTIRTSVNMLLQALTDAEALPRYEKLSVSNVRFMFFLVTGFEPAGYRTFGIPGFP